MGARSIIAVDVQPAKLERAAVQDLTGGGATHAFEVVGRSGTTMDAVAMLGIGGTAYLIGVHRPGATIEVTPFGDLMAARKKSAAWSWDRRT